MSPVVLICIPLITNEGITVFICLLTILVSGPVKFKSLPILPLDGVIFFIITVDQLTLFIYLEHNFFQLHGMEIYWYVVFIPLDL